MSSFGSGCDERIGLLMQHACKSELSVAEKLVNISSGPSGFRTA